jgi:hypothetical protein
LLKNGLRRTVLKGHDFSRAEKWPLKLRASQAAEKVFCLLLFLHRSLG